MILATHNPDPNGRSVLSRATRRIVLAGVVGCFAMSQALAAGAVEAYPEKPINLIVSYPAGGSVDVAARSDPMPFHMVRPEQGLPAILRGNSSN